MDVPWEVAELRRRLENVVRGGVVAEADYAAALARVRYALDEDGQAVLTGWIPFAAARAGGDRAWSAPEVGEQVLLLSPGGDLGNAVCALSLYSAAHPAPADSPDVSAAVAADGARVEYDRAAHRLRHAAQDGAAIQYDAGAHALSAALPAGATVSIVADGGVSIEGDVSVTGDVSATGDVSDRRSSMESMRGTYDGHVHPAGTPPGNTAATAQRMRS